MKKILLLLSICALCSFVGYGQSAPPAGDSIIITNYDTINCQFFWKITNAAGNSVTVKITDNTNNNMVIDTVISAVNDSGYFTINRILLANYPYNIVMKVVNDTAEWAERSFYTYVTPTGILNTPYKDCTIYSHDNTIYIENAENYLYDDIVIFDNEGRKVFINKILNSSVMMTTTLPFGSYILSVQKQNSDKLISKRIVLRQN